jgi:hypothetical protein
MVAGAGTYRRALLCLAAACVCPAQASAQQETAAPLPQGDSASSDRDILVVGQHVAGSAIGDAQPIGVLDEQAIHSLGAMTFKQVIDRLKPLTTSASGADAIYLLNGRRISGFEELESLPPEAIERTEILPQEEAVRFGFPPTQRVVNFITKKHFHALTGTELGGTTTEGGGGTNYAELNATKIDGPYRKSLSLSDLRQFPVLQSQRAIVPDASALYAIGGNVTGIGDASIDPALDALAGQPVTSVAVPANAPSRQTLAGYLPGANAPAVTDIGPYRSLVQRSDTLRLDSTIGTPIGKTMDGSLNLSLQSQHSDGLNGLAPALLNVPGGSGVFPFPDDVLLYRYLPGVVLHQRSSSLTVHGAATLQGGIHRWAWNVTTSYDRVLSTSVSEEGVPLDTLQAAIDAGSDPMAPIDAASAATRLTDRNETVTGTIASKAVVNGPLFHLPAGDTLLTVVADYARSTSSGEQSGAIGAVPNFARSITAGSANVSLPIASADQNALGFLGQFSINGTIGVSNVSHYGHLVTSNYGLSWAPLHAVQFSASINNAQTPPPIDLLTSPVLATPNTPVFDFTNGTTAFVTALTGGNAALSPEQRRTLTAGIALTPIKGKQLHLNFNYFDNRIVNHNASLGSVTAAFEAAFPDLFERDETGQLMQVDLRPVNLAQERQRELRVGLDFSSPLGHAPPAPVPGAVSRDAPPPKPRPTINVFINTTLRLEDRLLLRPGSPSLDLLDGATLNGTGGQPRWEIDGDVSGSVGALSAGIYGRLQGSTRIRSDLATSDLHFSGRTWLVVYTSLDMAKVIHRPWSHNMTTFLTVENLLNDRIDVIDRNGATPNRFQSAYIDPTGRSIRLGIRKQF